MSAFGSRSGFRVAVIPTLAAVVGLLAATAGSGATPGSSQPGHAPSQVVIDVNCCFNQTPLFVADGLGYFREVEQKYGTTITMEQFPLPPADLDAFLGGGTFMGPGREKRGEHSRWEECRRQAGISVGMLNVEHSD